MTTIDLTFATAFSFGISWLLILTIAKLVRPYFLRSPLYIRNQKISVLLEIGQTLLFTLAGTIAGAGVLALTVTAGAAVAGVAA